MKKAFNVLTIGVGACTILLGSCKRDDDLPEVPQPVVNEPEVITTVELHFTEQTSGDHVHAEWSDPDGPGGDDPVVEEIILDSGKVYDLEIMFLDESGDTAEDMTSEVKEEDDEHIICLGSGPFFEEHVRTIIKQKHGSNGVRVIKFYDFHKDRK